MRISNSSVVALDELWTVSDASGDQVSLLDTIQDPQALDPAMEMDTTEMKDRLADAIARLPEREKLVVALYYYENLTLREIGEVLGVTESRVSQLHTKAVLRLEVPPAGRSHRRRRVGRAGARSREHTASPRLPRWASRPCRRAEPRRGLIDDGRCRVAARELEADQVAVLELTRDGRGMLARAAWGSRRRARRRAARGPRARRAAAATSAAPARSRPRSPSSGRSRRTAGSRALHAGRLRVPPGASRTSRRGG